MRAHDGTIRRECLKELGTKLVHIDPYFNHTGAFMGGKCLAPRPGTDTALALSVAHTWIVEELYDKEFVEKRMADFGEWKDYLLGSGDVPKTPEWQEAITGIPAREALTLAREWGTKPTYLSPEGFPGLGGACRCSHGTEWTRAMVCLMAMQSLGKPGVNFGGAPGRNASRHAHGFRNLQEQLVPRRYPAPGYKPCRMFYRYGGSNMGTMPDSHRYARMYRAVYLEFVVNQSIWFEGEVEFADIILSACTSFERWEISEVGHCGGYVEENYLQNNYRMFLLQQKCIEPLGGPKSDYQIFLDIACRLNLGLQYSVASTELDWAKRIFEATDLPDERSREEFLRKGYHVLPPLEEGMRDPVAYNWHYDDKPRDVPEVAPLASDYTRDYSRGFQTQSGKFEFAYDSLRNFDPDHPDRPVVCKYICPIEGRETTEKYAKSPP